MKRYGKYFTLFLLLTMIFVFGISGTVFAEKKEAEGEKAYFFGHDSLYMGDEWMKVTDKAIHYYCEDNGWRVLTQNAHLKAEDQIKQMRYFVSQGVDGIIWSPVDAVATADVAKFCKDNGVPTITYNTDVKSDAVPITILFDSYAVAQAVANEVVDYLKETYGKVEGLVISLQGDAANDTDRDRGEGYKDVFSKYPGINFVEYYTLSKIEVAETSAFNAIQQFGRPVAIVSQNTTNSRGGMNALKRQGMLVKRGEPGHLFIGSIGGAPAYLDMMKEGFCDRGYVQPNLFYGPLALHYLTVVIEQGEDALPDIGDVVTEEDLKITGGVHDIDPWKDQVCAPAEVAERWGHRWLKVQGMMVTPENVDDNRIWGNAARVWLE
jgi:ABC-type sugar transport system substrate-binding protein